MAEITHYTVMTDHLLEPRVEESPHIHGSSFPIDTVSVTVGQHPVKDLRGHPRAQVLGLSSLLLFSCSNDFTCTNWNMVSARSCWSEVKEMRARHPGSFTWAFTDHQDPSDMLT